MCFDDDDDPPLGSLKEKVLRAMVYLTVNVMFGVFVLILTCLGVAAFWAIILMCRSVFQ